MRTQTQTFFLCLLAGLAAGLAGAPVRADGTSRAGGASSAENLAIPTARAVETLTIDTPDAFESIAHAADPNIPALRVRARLIVRAKDRTGIDAVLFARKSGAAPRAGGSADSPLAGFWLIDAATVREAASLAASFRAEPRIAEAYLDTRHVQVRGLPTDPGFPNQWFLNNTVAPAACTNVVPAWMAGFTGAGVTVGVIDEGFNIQHPDLAANYAATPSQDDEGFSDHGTATAGLVAAVANDSIGGVGTAYGAQVARLYFGYESDNAAAFALRNDITGIKTNSWGPADIGNIYPMSSIELAALDTAVNTGRAGKGEIFVWACGNGAQNNFDRVDYDGYGSNRYSIAVGAIDNQDRAAVYSEPGSPLMVVTTSSYDFAGSGGSGIYTTAGSDTSGPGSYTGNFGGTSASSPIAAGVIALMLQANPNLGWRDVEHILINTARRVNPTDPGWLPNGAGRYVNYQYGFGAIDAGAAVALAQTFTSVPPEISYTSPFAAVNQPIPDNNTSGVISSIVIPENLTIERVQVVLNAPHPSIGDLHIVLTSPSGFTSLLADVRSDFTAGYNGYLFTIVRHWGERSHGVWTLRVADERAGNVGMFTSWQLKVYGYTPPCPPDWDSNGALSVQDIFSFLSDWFAGAGDFNNDGAITVQDIFDFLASWFAGCP